MGLGSGTRFGVWGLEFGVQGLGCRVQGAGCRVYSSPSKLKKQVGWARAVRNDPKMNQFEVLL